MKAANQLQVGDIGRAYKAWLAFNHKAKKNRIESFDLNRWLNVIRALNGKGGPAHAKPAKAARAWTKAQREKFKATIAKRES